MVDLEDRPHLEGMGARVVRGDMVVRQPGRVGTEDPLLGAPREDAPRPAQATGPASAAMSTLRGAATAIAARPRAKMVVGSHAGCGDGGVAARC